jgi:methionine aminotransferase
MSKLPNVGTTIFSVMSKMAMDHGAINLAQGFPNFAIDEKLNDCFSSEAKSLIHQYAPMPGSNHLLNKIQKMNLRTYGKTYETSSQILVTAGATQALFTAFQAFVNRGDEVLLLDPAYDCYDPSIVLSGGEPIHVSLTKDFRPDWEKIKSKVNSKTKMIVINNPHNPAGTLWSENDYLALESLCEEFPSLLVLADEVYEYITFEKDFISIKQREKLAKKMICVSSFGKIFHITGWKIGYLIASEDLMIELKKVHQFLVFCVNNFGQEAIANYIEIADFDEISRIYKRKRDLFAENLKASRFDLLPCEGSFFQLASYANISQEPDTIFTERMVKEFGVAAIPVSVFNEDGTDHKIIRFCFAKEDETLIEAAKKLCKI